MESSVLKKAGKFLSEQNRHRRWKKMTAGLGAAMVIVVACIMTSPAFTMERIPYCGMEEHTHTEDCYESVLICSQETADDLTAPEKDAENSGAPKTEPTESQEKADSTHHHEESCYEESRELVCGQEESEGHIHMEGCYETSDSGELICGQEESEGHVHTDDCYEVSSELTCEEEHEHGDDCYTETRILACGQEETEGHTHSEECYAPAEPVLVCGQEEGSGAHEHTDDCYETVQKLVCGIDETEAVSQEAVPEENPVNETAPSETTATEQSESPDAVPAEEAHVHTEACYELRLVCGKEEHTHEEACYERTYCGVRAHTHTDSCYDEAHNLICQEEEHVHTEDCYVERPVYCGKEEHVHTEGCYDGEHNLKCDREEHIHLKECYRIPGVSEEDQARVEAVSRLIAAVPSYEEIMETLDAIGDDEEAYYEYLVQTMSQVMEAYDAYMALEEELRQYVTDVDRLLELVEAFSSMGEIDLLALYDSNYGYYHQWQIKSINTSNYCQAGSTFYPFVVYGADKNVYEALNTNYIYSEGTDDEWVGIVMRDRYANEEGPYYITKILNAEKTTHETAQNNFRNYKMRKGEFMILFHGLPAVEVGDRVVLSFGYTWNVAQFKALSHVDATSIDPVTGKEWGLRGVGGKDLGIMVICNNMNPGEKTDDRTGLKKLGAEDGIADTNGLITVNLYDYHTDQINGNYRNNNNYPFFRSSTGLDSNSYSKRKIDAFAFGNVIVQSPTDTQDYVKAGINQGMPANKTGLNKHNGGTTVADDLVGGYPALKSGGSLNYLFNRPAASNVNGLFKYDPATGLYSYDSRENHAEYNAETNRFDVYNAKLTPNYVQYPFGNFLPFNKISADETTRSADIGRDDFRRMAAEARVKAMSCAQGSIERRRYEGLADSLARFVAMMDDRYPDGWSGYDAANAYRERTEEENTKLLGNLYNTDYSTETDFHFGMNMELQFVQPEGGKVQGKDMIYRFAGDDDVWVYIDGKLFLDLSGIHTEVGGEIDFAKGEVRYYPSSASVDHNGEIDFSAEPVIKVSFKDLGVSGLNENGVFENYTTHTMKFYYMERGSGSSVCKMEFNLPVMPKNSVGIGKVLSQDDDSKKWLGDPNFTFQVLKADANGRATKELFFKEGTKYRIYNASFVAIGDGVVGKDGKFTLEPGQYAVFPDVTADKGKFVVRELLDTSVIDQYGEITAEGSATTVSAENIVIADARYKGVDSPAQSISGNAEYTRITFDNQITTTQYGQLDITKKVDLGEGTEEGASAADEFKFTVELDGAKLEPGTVYTISKPGTVSRQGTVGEDGLITLHADETASISNILAGTKYKVQETKESSADYFTSYAVLPSSTGKVSEDKTYIEGTVPARPKDGSVSAGPTAAVAVTNKSRLTASASLEIAGKKILANPDGAEHKYSFTLEELTADGAVKAEGYTAKAEAVLTGTKGTMETQTFTFAPIIYRAQDLFGSQINPDQTPQIFYYRIKEVSDTDGVTQYDSKEYKVQVTVTMDDRDGIVAKVTAVDDIPVKEGEKPEDQIVFTNQLLHSLTIAKEVESMATETPRTFSFVVTVADRDGMSVKGRTFAVAGAKGDKTITFDGNGTAELTVEAGQALTIQGLPYSLSWEVTETGAEAYTVSHIVSADPLTDALKAEGRQSGNTASGSLEDSQDTVTFINTIVYELPSTGGPGTALYTIAGILLMLGAGFLYRMTFKGGRCWKV